jgi:hypothetical protein
MTYFNNDYDNLYPLHPEFIDSDSAADINPTIQRQHLAPFTDKQQGYYSAPPYQRSQDEFMGHPSRAAKVNTFSIERMVYDMNKQLNYLFYMNILLLIIIVVIVMCSIITVMGIGSMTKNSR